MGIIYFNGKSSDDYGIRVAEAPGYLIPQKDYTFTHVIGRNGDLLNDNKSWRNIEKRYKISSGEYGTNRAMEFGSKITDWLTSADGYCRLEDSYEPDYYRMAMYTGGTDLSNIYNQAVTGEIVFNCKPQKYLKTGEDTTVVKGVFEETYEEQDENVVKFYYEVHNPTNHIAKPIIHIFANVVKYGDLYMRIKIDGETAIEIREPGIYSSETSSISITMDCEKRTIYGERVSSDINMLSWLKMHTTKGRHMYEFPFIGPGTHSIEIHATNGGTFPAGGRVANMEVTPRWWTL